MTSLTQNKLIILRKPKVIIEDFQGCGINSLLVLLEHIDSKHNISIDECKKIFDYDKDGISEQKHRFNRFNNLLKDNKLPYKVYMQNFNSHQELLKFLDFPVPIYFSMKVIKFIMDKFKYSKSTFNFGDENALFDDPNHHLLLLVGYDDGGKKLYFVDPVYQLPYYTTNDLCDKNKLCSLDTRQFYECVKFIKSYMQIKYIPTLEKKYTSEKKEKGTQKKLQ